jgi:ABC-type lipoprotein export system ATPase subunit
MEVTGKVKVIANTQEVGTSGFKKRDIVVTTDEQYPQHISVQFVQDKCDLLDKFNVGENVTIGVNLRGREWTNAQGETQYFNTIQGWKISKAETQSESAPEAPQQEEESDDLPY